MKDDIKCGQTVNRKPQTELSLNLLSTENTREKEKTLYFKDLYTAPTALHKSLP